MELGNATGLGLSIVLPCQPPALIRCKFPQAAAGRWAEEGGEVSGVSTAWPGASPDQHNAQPRKAFW